MSSDKKYKLKSLRIGIIGIILMAITVIIMYIVHHEVVNEYILTTKYKIELPLWLLIILIPTIFLVIRASKFLRKIYKDSKKVIVIGAKPPKDYEHLPIIKSNSAYVPSKEETEILLLYKNNKSIYPDDLLSISPLSADKTNLCFKNLYDNNFLEIKNEDGEELKYLIQNRFERYRYTLSQKGLEFLNDNKLLD